MADDNIDKNECKFTERDTLPWIEKYRPTSLDEVVSHSEIISTLKTFIKNRCMPHLLFYGPPGTGKTSTIIACAKQLFGEYYPYMVMELNASDDRGIEVVRTRIKQFVTSDNVFFGKTLQDRSNIFRLVILDEADAMTSDAQAILRKIVEKYTYNTRFCLVCNYIKNINPALQSRCTRFRFSPLMKETIREKIIDISSQENLKITEKGIDTIIKISNGDMRKVLNILQSTSMAYNVINERNVNTCIGYPRDEQIRDIIEALFVKSFSQTFDTLVKIKKNYGLSLNDIIHELHLYLSNKLMNGESGNQYVDEMNDTSIIGILEKMRIIEYNLATCTTDSLQLAGFIGVFKINL